MTGVPCGRPVSVTDWPDGHDFRTHLAEWQRDRASGTKPTEESVSSTNYFPATPEEIVVGPEDEPLTTVAVRLSSDGGILIAGGINCVTVVVVN